MPCAPSRCTRSITVETGSGAERFEAALTRAKDRVADKKPIPAELTATARPPQQFLERVVIRDGTRVTLIPITKLDYVEAQDDYVALASNGTKHLKQQNDRKRRSGAWTPRDFSHPPLVHRQL